MKMLLTNKYYVVLAIALGGGVGFFNTLATQMQQFACSRGYSDETSGLAVTIMIVSGMFGSMILGAIVATTGKLEEVIKLCGGISALFGLLVGQIIRKPDIEWAIFTSMAW